MEKTFVINLKDDSESDSSDVDFAGVIFIRVKERVERNK